jgi:hypothetical protein
MAGPGNLIPIAGTYSPKNIVITVDGIPISGFADGDAIGLEYGAPRFTKKVGMDGEVVRSQSPDFSGTLKIRLMQTSLSNDLLDTYAKLDQLTGLGGFTLMMADLRSGANYTAVQAWISAMPPVNYGMEAGQREWSIDFASMVPVNAGTIPTTRG